MKRVILYLNHLLILIMIPKDLPWEKEEAKSKFSLDTSQAKQTKKDEFDNLFNN